MSATSGPSPSTDVPAASPQEAPWETGQPPLLGWRVFPGDHRQLGPLRGWLASLLPECSERHDLLAIATELASNAVKHTASGRGGSFAVALMGGSQVMRIAVADGGALAGPRMNEDPAGENGRGMLIVRGLSVRTGACGDEQGRLVWAEIPWHAAWAGSAPVHVPAQGQSADHITNHPVVNQQSASQDPASQPRRQTVPA